MPGDRHAARIARHAATMLTWRCRHGTDWREVFQTGWRFGAKFKTFETPLLISKNGLLRDGGATLIRALAAENTAKRKAVLGPRQPRLELLYCGACCGDTNK